jgi:hypothetical protein
MKLKAVCKYCPWEFQDESPELVSTLLRCHQFTNHGIRPGEGGGGTATVVPGPELVDDLADVLSRVVVGWENILGVDLAMYPDVQRVLKRYRDWKAGD